MAAPKEKTYTLEELKDLLNEKQKIFCHEYCVEWNATKSYKKAYGNEKDDNQAAANGARLIRNDKIKQYIEYIKTDYEFLCGISKTKQIEELKKIAYSSIAHLHNTWITLKEFESITDEQKEAIESIDTKTEQKTVYDPETEESETVTVKYIKIKLHSKIAALDQINKMMGYNEAEKIDIQSKGKKIKLNISNND